MESKCVEPGLLTACWMKRSKPKAKPSAFVRAFQPFSGRRGGSGESESQYPDLISHLQSNRMELRKKGGRKKKKKKFCQLSDHAGQEV